MSKRYFIRKKNVDIVSETFDASKDSDVVLEETMVYTSNRVRGVTKPTSIKNVAQLNEMARINTSEPQGAIFPYSEYDVHIWSNDHDPAHFHVITVDWDVSFLISNASLYKVNKEGKKKKTLKYMCNNVTRWLNSPCAALPVITNQQNAQLQWIQLHPPKK